MYVCILEVAEAHLKISRSLPVSPVKSLPCVVQDSILFGEKDPSSEIKWHKRYVRILVPVQVSLQTSFDLKPGKA